jgi:hypothetical protein
MDSKMTEWMLSFPCSRCAFMGIEKLGTVHVLGKDEQEELQIVAFCYDCARVMMERRKRPRTKNRTSSASLLVDKRVVSLNPPNRAQAKGWEACVGTINNLKCVIGDFQGAVETTLAAVNKSKEVRRGLLNERKTSAPYRQARGR